MRSFGSDARGIPEGVLRRVLRFVRHTLTPSSFTAVRALARK